MEIFYSNFPKSQAFTKAEDNYESEIPIGTKYLGKLKKILLKQLRENLAFNLLSIVMQYFYYMALHNFMKSPKILT